MWILILYLLFAIISLAGARLDPKFKTIVFRFRMACLAIMGVAYVVIWALPFGAIPLIGRLFETVLTLAALGTPIYLFESHIRKELNKRGHLPGGRKTLP